MFGGPSMSQRDAEAAMEQKAEKRRRIAVELSAKRAKVTPLASQITSTLDLALTGDWQRLEEVCAARQGMSIVEEDNVALCAVCKLGNYNAVLALLYMGTDPCWENNKAVLLARDSDVPEIVALLEQQAGVSKEERADDTAWADSLLYV